jgi:hypothetical protein
MLKQLGGGDLGPGGNQGLGGRVQCKIVVTPGQTLACYVASSGGAQLGPTRYGGPGGLSAGDTGTGPYGGVGGEPTVIYLNGVVIIVAGAGGGAGSPNTAGSLSGGKGGAGGGTVAAAGTVGSGANAGNPGGGGTQAAGGSLGTGHVGASSAGSVGKSFTGGAGGNSGFDWGGGGGGGGGYFGGGGGQAPGAGASGGGAGGGSSFVASSINGTAPTNVVHTQGYAGSNGYGTVTFTWADPPAAPTAITPAAGSTKTVVNPTLTGTQAANPSGLTQRAEWQLATDAAFTANAKIVTEPTSSLRASGAASTSPPSTVLSLSNGVWYLRARSIDSDGNVGNWSASQTFTVNVAAPPVPTAVTPANASTVVISTPNLGSTLSADPGGRLLKGQWQIATDNAFSQNIRTVTEDDSVLRASGAASSQVPQASRLGVNGVYYLRARSVGSDGSVSAWTATQTFTVTLPDPGAPTVLTPAAGATVTTDNPTLGATLPAVSEGRTVKGQWQLATDAAFSVNLKTITEADSDLRVSGSTTEVIPAASSLTQTIWYMRARVVDQFGNTGSWSASQSFTVNHQPSTNNWSPTGATTLQYGATNTFSWLFSDPSASDSQRAYQFVIERNDTGATVVDTGKTVSSAGSINVAIPAAQKDQPLRWRVRVWDQDDVASAWSSYQPFYVSDPPVITITNPSNDGVQIGTGRPTITWTLDAQTVGTTYRAQFIRVLDNVVVHDSGITGGSPLAYSPAYTILDNNISYRLDLTVTDNVGLSTTAHRTFTTSYQAPATVLYTVNSSQYADSGYVLVDWSGMNPDNYFSSWRVYRRALDDTDWIMLEEFTAINVRQYQDWMALSGVPYLYAVSQVADRSGLLFESVLNPTPELIQPISDQYWLINPEDSSVNFLLHNVTGEEFTREIEQETYVVIGRGRRTDYGTDLGHAGTLTAQLRNKTNGLTARQQKQAIELLQGSRSSYYVRNPFGDIFLVSLGTLSISRIAGTGTDEFCTVQLPYTEVF